MSGRSTQTAAALTSQVAAASGAATGATLLVLGIPLEALLAALIGAALSYVARPAVSHSKIPVRLLGIVSDALIGGWLFVIVVKLTPLHRFGVAEIPIEAGAGLLALLWRVLRVWLPAKLDRAFDAVLAFWTRDRGQDGEGGSQ
ncbi:hypothetical protein [Lysobacter firmicutimachus]|uniref:Phage holin family protein n=1 Tax=Lysobacter firmicutimachus TaxID=1792846 RepID=A0ABU8CYI5_9GAMM